ncbi:alkaline phosphatase D family protein [Lewinella sp. JB7]|uniref:alkaline phosphatase D family protein n=1 Tax=Lewinella sp. JB7 TaxID=2962887 RepID=UPI0020C954C1|nr:alkaline phosphatase D family protein [Lewinella sp. JB7]MCP9237355.1 alkaline phosphatase D family protein [Lewinella sp. JB7]
MRLPVYVGLLLGILLGSRAPAQTIYTHDRQLGGAAVEGVDEALYPFYHGVASGDPLADRVIIWTRVTPDSLGNQPLEVAWTMATDPQLEQVVREGTVTTDADLDYTVKVDVDGLAAGTTYYYGFRALGRPSLTGRTKTTPTGSTSDHLRFGVVSCSNYQAGYFNAYARLAERNDLDAVIHLGDYIYEYANFVYGNAEVWDDRTVAPDREIVSLFDYRTRYGTYRLDPDLRRLHQQHPIIAVWDDHESANDSYAGGASNHQSGSEGSWEDRKDRSRRAYFEWMPIRDTGNRSIYRKISYGDIADLVMLDTRLEGRDRQLDDVTDPALYAEDRTMLGAAQKAWLLDQLRTSTARWKLIGNQVIFSEFNVGWSGALVGQPYEFVESGFLDIWDGYPAERTQITQFIENEPIENVVLLTGDFHVSLAFEVADPPVALSFREVDGQRVPVYGATDYDPATGSGAVAVEFATPSISAANFDENVSLPIALALQARVNQPLPRVDTLEPGNPNPHLKYADLTQHGYYVLDVRPTGVQADYFYGPILQPSNEESFAAGYFSDSGTHRLQSAVAPAAAKSRSDAPAPADPPGTTTAVTDPDEVTVLSLSPNPVGAEAQLQYALRRSGRVEITLLDAAGRKLRTLRQLDQIAGVYGLAVRLHEYPAGTYYVRIRSAGGSSVQPLIKR